MNLTSKTPQLIQKYRCWQTCCTLDHTTSLLFMGCWSQDVNGCQTSLLYTQGLWHRPSSLISVRLFTLGHHSPTEYLLTARMSSCWSTSSMLWCLSFCATAALPGLPSSYQGPLLKKRVNDKGKICQGCQGSLNKRLKYMLICLQI